MRRQYQFFRIDPSSRVHSRVANQRLHRALSGKQFESEFRNGQQCWGLLENGVRCGGWEGGGGCRGEGECQYPRFCKFGDTTKINLASLDTARWEGSPQNINAQARKKQARGKKNLQPHADLIDQLPQPRPAVPLPMVFESRW